MTRSHDDVTNTAAQPRTDDPRVAVDPPQSPAVTIGIDVGGTKILGVTVVGDRVVDRERVPSTTPESDVVEQIDRVATELLRRADLDGSIGRPEGIGLGIAGFVGLDGVAVAAPNTKGLEGVDLRRLLMDRHGVPVTVDNDANCVAIAAAHGRSTEGGLVAVTLGTGIGGGLVIGGGLYRGRHGFAGEPGHMVVDPAGPPCPCGSTGCWERFASGTGLAWLARRAVDQGRAPSVLAAAGSLDAIEGTTVTRLLGEGDPGAEVVFEEFLFYLTLGTANLIMLLDPAEIVIGGGLTVLGDRLLDGIERSLRENFPAAVQNRTTRVEIAELGEDAGAWGAALLTGRGHPGGDVNVVRSMR